MDALCAMLDEAQNAHARVLVGFDFGFGYPRGFAHALTGQPFAFGVWDLGEIEPVGFIRRCGGQLDARDGRQSLDVLIKISGAGVAVTASYQCEQA